VSGTAEVKNPKSINTHQRKFAVENKEIEGLRRPDWLKVKLPTGKNYYEI